MNIFKNSLKKVVFFLSLSSLYYMFFNFYSISVFATDGGKPSSGNADVYKEIPYIAKYIIQWDFVLSSAGLLLYYLCLGLVFLLNEVYAGITGIFDVIGKIFSDSPIAEFFKQFNVMIFPILTVSLGLYGLYAVFFGSNKMKPLAKGVVVITGTLLFASTIIALVANTTQNVVSTISVTDSKCDKLSFGSCIAKSYIVDVPYYASQKNENGNRNNIKTNQELFGLRYNEGIGPDYEYNGFKRDLNIPTRYDENGNVREALGLKSGEWWKLNSDFVSYQKWNVNFIGLILNLSVILFSLLGSGFRIGIIVFDGVLVSGLLPLIGSTDIGGGQKVKNAIKMIFVGFANIVLYMIVIKFFGEFILMINRLNVNWLSYIFLIAGASIAVFNLPQTVARIFNIAPPKEANILQRALLADRLLNRTKRGFRSNSGNKGKVSDNDKEIFNNGENGLNKSNKDNKKKFVETMSDNSLFSDNSIRDNNDNFISQMNYERNVPKQKPVLKTNSDEFNRNVDFEKIVSSGNDGIDTVQLSNDNFENQSSNFEYFSKEMGSKKNIVIQQKQDFNQDKTKQLNTKDNLTVQMSSQNDDIFKQ